MPSLLKKSSANARAVFSAHLAQARSQAFIRKEWTVLIGKGMQREVLAGQALQDFILGDLDRASERDHSWYSVNEHVAQLNERVSVLIGLGGAVKLSSAEQAKNALNLLRKGGPSSSLTSQRS
jgi:hypothetical protein